MIKIKATYICDACGKRHVENLEQTNYLEAMTDSKLPYTPDGWSIDVFSYGEQRLLCTKCTKTSQLFHSDDNSVVGDRYPL